MPSRICLNFGLAAGVRRQVQPALRRHQPDARKSSEYVDSIMEDVRWLGFDWEDRLFYASDYFEQLYEWAVQLIKDGKAYVCDLTADEIREYRGTLTAAGQEQPVPRPHASRRISTCSSGCEAGEFPDGARTLRAKIDMASPNLNMRDPVMYRILHADASPHGRQVVHLPDVRLRARPVRLDRADHALDLHAGVREPPAAVRLVHRASWASTTRSRSSSPG